MGQDKAYSTRKLIVVSWHRGEAVGEGIVAEVGQQPVRGRGRGRPRGIRGGRRALG